MILPDDIIDYIKSFIPFFIMKYLKKETNEMINARKLISTPSAYCINIMISRFLWRWNPETTMDDLYKIKLIKIPDVKYQKTREKNFINDSLKFHKLWIGPPIPYSDWCIEKGKREKNNIYYGSN